MKVCYTFQFVFPEGQTSIVTLERIEKDKQCLKFSCVLFQSKGGILSKACEYIKELRQSNLKLGEDISTLDRLRIDNQLLRQEVCLHVFFQYGLKC